MADLTAIILTRNEEIHIERAIACLRQVCSRVVVVDSYSTDRTVELATAQGAEVFQNSWVNYADQFRWALRECAIGTEWVMRFDADECFETDLAEEINRRLADLQANVTGVNLRRRHYFLGDWVRYGGRYPLILLRIWRRGAALIEQRWMDEHVYLLRGNAVTFDCDFADKNLSDVGQWTGKHIRYADREALDVLMQNLGMGLKPESIASRNANFQAKLKRVMKERLYNRLPYLAGPMIYFSYRFFFLGGLFDTPGGRAYHILQGLWYRTLVDVRLSEFEKATSSAKTDGERLNILEGLTGLKIRDYLASNDLSE
tara:strand:- start:744 stop:1688 length:945 start_codon:yes stop_codon:yes gene_type:complete